MGLDTDRRQARPVNRGAASFGIPGVFTNTASSFVSSKTSYIPFHNAYATTSNKHGYGKR